MSREESVDAKCHLCQRQLVKKTISTGNAGASLNVSKLAVRGFVATWIHMLASGMQCVQLSDEPRSEIAHSLSRSAFLFRMGQCGPWSDGGCLRSSRPQIHLNFPGQSNFPTAQAIASESASSMVVSGRPFAFIVFDPPGVQFNRQPSRRGPG